MTYSYLYFTTNRLFCQKIILNNMYSNFLNFSYDSTTQTATIFSKFLKIPLVKLKKICYYKCVAGVAEWQTHQTQNLTGATSCEFESRHQH